MAAVEVEISWPTAFDGLMSPAKSFATRARPQIEYRVEVGAEPADIFVLDGTLFTSLQLYIHTAFVFPSTTDLFHSQHPFQRFEKWLSKLDYDGMVSVLTTIHEHCATFQTKGINPMVQLSHTIANFAGDAANLIGNLKEQFETICDDSVPLTGTKAKEARSNAKEILTELRARGNDVHKECRDIFDATKAFATKTLQDKQALSALIEKLDRIMPQQVLDKEMSDTSTTIRDSLSTVLKRQEEVQEIRESRKAEVERDYRRGLPQSMAEFSWRWIGPATTGEIERLARSYMETVVKGDLQKLELVKSIDNVRGLSSSIHRISEYVEDAKKCVENMMDGITELDTNAEAMTKKIDGLSGQVKVEGPGSLVMTRIHADSAVRAWNVVLRVTREFAKKGVIQSAEEYKALQRSYAPQILAAHYGGQDVTILSRILFINSDNITIDTKDIPIPDPWKGTRKSLSIVYRFGESPNSLNVFVGEADQGRCWVLKEGNPHQDPEVTLAGSLNVQGSGIGLVQIHAVVYGLHQITDTTVYEKLYHSAVMNTPIPVTNEFFGTEPWHGVGKSAAVIYSFNGQVKAIAGREFSNMRWDF